MKKKVWDIIAPFYKIQVSRDRKTYNEVSDLIIKMVLGKEILELATGNGVIAKNIAGTAKKVVATDYSEEMIKQAKKGENPKNIEFSVVDAMDLPYEESSFDVVIIANALHIIPGSKTVLGEIKRVLKNDGILIAPNYVTHNLRGFKKLWLEFLKLIGVKFNNIWNVDGYKNFLEDNGFKVLSCKVIQGKIPMAYVECEENNI